MDTSNKGRVYVPPGSLMKKRMQQPREKQVPLQGKNITHSRVVDHTSDRFANDIDEDVDNPNANPKDREDLHIGENAKTAADNVEGANYEQSTDGLGCSSTNNLKRKRPNQQPRGPNKCKQLSNLRNGEKLEVTYFHNGPVGANHKIITRNMGKLVRDPNVCPVCVHSWNEINENAKEHMWAAVLFKGKDCELDRNAAVEHMKNLWHKWRGSLMQGYIKPAKTKECAMEKVPRSVSPEDWKWLLDEHFFNDDFLEVSRRNFENRSNLTMLHHTGSTPFQQIIYDKLGGKDGNMPKVAEIFKETRQQKSRRLDDESNDKLEEIITKSKENPHYCAFELVEDCFRPQDRNHVTCFGYGMKPKDVRGPLPSRAELQAMLHSKEKENVSLHKHINDLEDAHKREISKLEDEMRMVVEFVMSTQPQSGVPRGYATSGPDHHQDD